MKNIPAFQSQLLHWYQKNARDLPWRRTKDPYKIWISEIMLQQTQVDTVIPYYQRWIAGFPNIKELADAPIDEVLKYWAGLGYYRRARMIHMAAKRVTSNGGSFPNTFESIIALHGVGRYTAGAIASIAYGQKVPVLDGNVIRILTRIFAIKKDIGSQETISELWKLSESLLPDHSIGDFNQALMELGALICSPKKPKCLLCPMVSLCKAYSLGKQEKFPVKGKNQEYESLQTAALVMHREKKVLIRKQPAQERWGGLWMFPHWQDLKSMLCELKLSVADLNSLMTVKHAYTKYRIKLDVFQYSTKKSAPKNVSAKAERWVKISELENFAFPSPHQKIVRELLKKNG